MKITYQFPEDFQLHRREINFLLRNSHRLTDDVLRRAEAICREKGARNKVRWESKPGLGFYYFWPALSHFKAAMKAAK